MRKQLIKIQFLIVKTYELTFCQKKKKTYE
jgi:hypothetical protein